MEQRFLVRISQMYYEENMSQQEIADELKISRIKVSRSLKKAKKKGIIKVLIDYQGTFINLEQKLKRKYNLNDVIIVENSLDNNAKNQIQQAGAEYLKTKLNDGDTIAVGWGTTLKGIPHYMHNFYVENVTFTPIIGGHSVDHSQIHSSTIALEMAMKIDGEAVTLNAPALVPSVEEKLTLMNNKAMMSVLRQSAAADIALFSLGNPLFSESSIHDMKYFSEKDLLELKENKVVCDFISIDFLNKYGEQQSPKISERTIGLKIEELLKIPIKICLVNGEEKYESVLAALRARYIDVLIIDNKTADYLINV